MRFKGFINRHLIITSTHNERHDIYTLHKTKINKILILKFRHQDYKYKGC
jgi:hypothetical protein